jgi:hypothetical protein
MRRGDGSVLIMGASSTTPTEIRRDILARLASETTATLKELLQPFPCDPERLAYLKEILTLLDEGVIRIISRRPAISRDGRALCFRATRYALARGGRS